MPTRQSKAAAERLSEVLTDLAPFAVAVSGGVDSMTLAVLAQRQLRHDEGLAPVMIHARSAAVPVDASERVARYAERERFRLETIDAGEFNDPDYRANPANRCFFCKTNLYATMADRTDRQLVSGTNLDDLDDYRPGLQAAEKYAVRHPYVEADIDKSTVRELARDAQLNDLAELPAAPCLSSRIETGIRIEPSVLLAIDAVEKRLRESLKPTTARCRLRSDAIVVELDESTLRALSAVDKAEWETITRELFADTNVQRHVVFERYQRGSAFLIETLSASPA